MWRTGSSEPAANNRPLPEKASLAIPPFSCICSTRAIWSVRRSQRRTLESVADTNASVLPSGDNALMLDDFVVQENRQLGVVVARSHHNRHRSSPTDTSVF